jgi:1-acyl-sn-glycerol-3-phosphate acyltransferase
MSHTIALIRLTLMVLFSCVSVPVAVLIGLLGAVTGRSGRTRALRILPHLTSVWSRINLALMGVRITTPDPRPARAGLLTSNHLSYLDIMVVAALFPSRFVAKQEIASWPFIGLLTRSVGTLFLDRGRNREVPRISTEIQRTLGAGISVVFFPEGGISDGETVRPFHGGLLETAVQESIECLPLCLHYGMANPAVSPAETICWAGEQSFLSHFWRLLRHNHIEARVRWSPTPLTDTDRKSLARRLHAETMRLFEPIRR